MAGFADIVRQGVALADSLTSTLQDEVTYEAWTGSDGFGEYSFAAPVQIPALIEKSDKTVIDMQGREIRAEHVISLLRPIAANGATGRREPIDNRDKFTLPDGSTGIIAGVDTLVDPDTGAGYYHIVSLGRVI